jgi:hypothetical protein
VAVRDAGVPTAPGSDRSLGLVAGACGLGAVPGGGVEAQAVLPVPVLQSGAAVAEADVGAANTTINRKPAAKDISLAMRPSLGARRARCREFCALTQDDRTGQRLLSVW